jgi:hypothetical protein
VQTERKIPCGCGHPSDFHYAVGVWVSKGRVCGVKGCNCVRYEPDYDAWQRIQAEQRAAEGAR